MGRDGMHRTSHLYVSAHYTVPRQTASLPLVSHDTDVQGRVCTRERFRRPEYSHQAEDASQSPNGEILSIPGIKRLPQALLGQMQVQNPKCQY